jgi:hypothetical protein
VKYYKDIQRGEAMKIISKIISVKAMAVPAPTGETAKKMKEQGLYVIQEMMSRMPNTNQADMELALKDIIDSGASEFFRGMKAKTIISLPKIYILDPDDVFEVDGKKYVSIEVSPPREVKKSWDAPSGTHYEKAKKGEPPTMFEGEVTALDLDTGLPVVLSLPPIQDKITAPVGNRDEVLQKVNAEIAKYNERISTIGNAIGASKLVLQIARAKDQIQTRLNTLDGMKQALRRQLEYYSNGPKQAFESWANDLKEGVKSGRMSLKDVYDTILYLHMSTPEDLINKINDLGIPEELKAGVLAIAQKEVQSTKSLEEKETREDQERERKIKEKTIPELHEEPITPFSSEDIPGAKQKYKEVRTPKSLWAHIAGIKYAIAGSERDSKELTEIKQSIDNMEQYMGALEKGQRGKGFLNTPEGQPILAAMTNFLEKSSMFIKRYATDIIQDNKVNPKLMGTEGTQGNALLAVALTRMYNVTKETIDMYTGGRTTPPSGAMSETPSVRDTVEAPQPVSEPVANTQNKITKMSSLLWKAFEERMRLK